MTMNVVSEVSASKPQPVPYGTTVEASNSPGGIRWTASQAIRKDMLEEFHTKFDQHPNESEDSILERTLNMIEEESTEVIDAFDDYMKAVVDGEDTFDCRTHLLKELADLAYVVEGTAHKLGLNLDIAFNRVHMNNMDKVWPDGTVCYREGDGKVLKPEGHRPPELWDLV